MVEERKTVITAGWTTDQFESLFPPGIPIGVVESVGQQDVDLFKRIQIAPLVDFDSLAAVVVLIEKERPAQSRQNTGQGQQGNGAGRRQETTSRP